MSTATFFHDHTKIMDTKECFVQLTHCLSIALSSAELICSYCKGEKDRSRRDYFTTMIRKAKVNSEGCEKLCNPPKTDCGASLWRNVNPGIIMISDHRLCFSYRVIHMKISNLAKKDCC